MKVDLATFELQNLVREREALRVRSALTSVKTPTASTSFVGSMTIESPFTSEPWQYLFEQDGMGAVTLRVFTEEFVEVYSYALGVLQRDPVFSHGVVLNQVMIGSPALSAPLYGLPGGGLIAAVKTASINPDSTALEIPSGHVASFGDRVPIAQGNLLFMNDPPSDAGVDIRTYVAENAIPFPGTIYDHFQGPDGAHYIFTSAGVFTIPQDALGQGQQVAGFIGRIPGIETTKPRNACATNAGVVVLQKDAVVLLPSETRIPLELGAGRRFFSEVTEVEDLRRAAEVFPTPTGVLIGLRGRRGFFYDLDLQARRGSWVTHASQALNVVGTLRSRDGELLIVTSNAVLAYHGTVDTGGVDVVGVASGRIPIDEDDQPTVRRVTVSADNIGDPQDVAVDGGTSSETTPTKTGDVIIGTTTWSASATYGGRGTRTVRHSLAVKTTDPLLEVKVQGAGRRVEQRVEVELTGQGRQRKDRS